MSKRLKLGVCVLLGLGVFMGICAIIKAVQLESIRNVQDPTCEFNDLCVELGLTMH